MGERGLLTSASGQEQVAGCCQHLMTSYVLASQEGLWCMELARCA